MDGRELLHRLVSRWPLVVVGALLALVVGGVVFAVTPASYTAQAGVLVLPPPTEPGEVTQVNPLASLDNGAIQVASTLVYAASAPATVNAVADASDGGTATVLNTTDDPSNDTPFIQITATGSTEADARAAATATISALNGQLHAIQTNSRVPTSLLMHLAVIVPPATSVASTSGMFKAAGLAAILVFVIALIVIAVLDRFLPDLDLRALTRTIDAAPVSVASGD